MAIEESLARAGCGMVAGVDEAGRGPLAGPVVAAAVIIDPQAIPPGLNDSKKLTPTKRQACFGAILVNAHVSWAATNAGEIDSTDIRKASLAAMSRALAALPVQPDGILVDGRDLPPLPAAGVRILDARPVIGGDAKSLSIAAASIIAKCVRDAMMTHAATRYPGYGFERHFGYPTKAHLEALARQGPCPLHRQSFAPVRRVADRIEATRK